MSEIESIKRETTKNSKRVLFGMPRLGSSLVLGIEGIALFSLYTIGYGLDEFVVGFAMAMGYLSIAVGQFLFGWLSDAKYTKFGRRKPYILIFGPLLGISFIFLLLPGLVLPNMNDKSALFNWLLIWDIIFRFSYSVTTPYQAWMAELFPVNERPQVSQLQNTFNFIGNGIMSVAALLIFTKAYEQINLTPSAIPTTFSLVIFTFGLIAVIVFLLIVFLLPTEPKYEIKTDLWENLKTTVKNKNFMLVVLMQGISGFGWAMISTVMLSFTELVLGLGDTDYYIIAVCLLLSIFVFLYLWRKRIEKIGKKKTLLYIFLIAIFFLPISLLGLVPAIPPLILGIIFIIGIGAILGGWYLFPYIIYADIAEDDEKSTGDLKAGIYTGFPSIILNIFQAIGVFLLGIITSLRKIVIGTNFFSIGYVLWGPICSLILIVAYFYTRKFVKLDFDWEKK